MSQSGLVSITDKNIPGDVATSYIADIGVAVPVGHVLNIFGGPGVQTVGVGNTITINVVTSGFTWHIVNSVSPVNPIQILVENGYSCQGALLVTFLLPLAPVLGDTFIVASTTSRFQIAANAGQQMRVGNIISTAGAGTVTSKGAGDCVEFVYMGSNIFQCFSLQGTLTVT